VTSDGAVRTHRTELGRRAECRFISAGRNRVGPLGITRAAVSRTLLFEPCYSQPAECTEDEWKVPSPTGGASGRWRIPTLS
jgi:hypothetical protein